MNERMLGVFFVRGRVRQGRPVCACVQFGVSFILVIFPVFCLTHGENYSVLNLHVRTVWFEFYSIAISPFV